MQDGGLRRTFGVFVALIAASAAASSAFGVTQYQTEHPPFLFDVTSFTTTMDLPVSDEVETLRMSEQIMRQRLERAPKDQTVEPLTVLLGDQETEIAAMAEKIALSGKEDELANYLRTQLRSSKSTKDGSHVKTVMIDATAYKLIDKDAFADIYAKPHHNLTIDTSALKSDRVLRAEFFHQISPYFSAKERTSLHAKVAKSAPIDVNTELLPEFPRKMLKKFIAYRGPNCFQAALAFQSPKMTSSSLINVKNEIGYHRAMINYDELWRALSELFYEVKPDKNSLKYGDIVVFFDVPKDAADDSNLPIDYRWIRHTATYLFSGYTFSKGSKSPNTPYTVRTLAEEWRTWKHFTKKLGVKVFRRSELTVKVRPPEDLTDWVY